MPAQDLLALTYVTDDGGKYQHTGQKVSDHK